MNNTNRWRWMGWGIVAIALAGSVACQDQGQSPPANLVPVTAQIDFGDVLVGTTSAPRRVSWTNTGDDTAEIFGLPIDNARFEYSGGPFQSAVVNVGATSPQWPIVFRPTALGAQTGEVKPRAFNPSGANRPQVTAASLKGNGVAQIALGDLSIFGGHVTPGALLDFGDVPVGTTSSVHTFIIRNSSTTQARVVTVQWVTGNQGFAVTTPGQQFTIPPGVTMPVTLTFTPTAVGDFADSVRFTVSGGGHEAATAVKGKGVQGE